MANVVSHQRVHGLKGESGPQSDMAKPKPVDDVRKDEFRTEGNSNSNESWCYWVPFPGVRYYCYAREATNVGPVEHSPQSLPT